MSGCVLLRLLPALLAAALAHDDPASDVGGYVATADPALVCARTSIVVEALDDVQDRVDCAQRCNRSRRCATFAFSPGTRQCLQSPLRACHLRLTASCESAHGFDVYEKALALPVPDATAWWLTQASPIARLDVPDRHRLETVEWDAGGAGGACRTRLERCRRGQDDELSVNPNSCERLCHRKHRCEAFEHMVFWPDGIATVTCRLFQSSFLRGHGHLLLENSTQDATTASYHHRTRHTIGVVAPVYPNEAPASEPGCGRHQPDPKPAARLRFQSGAVAGRDAASGTGRERRPRSIAEPLAYTLACLAVAVLATFWIQMGQSG